MKKEKEKQQHYPEPTTATRQTSSAAVALQLLNKEKIKDAEKKESAAEAVKVRCKTCFKEIAPTPRCFGHGGGGGGGSNGASDKTSEETSNPGENKTLTKSGEIVEIMNELMRDFATIGASEALHFDPEIIEDLISKGKLLVDSDPESMTLTIKLLCEPNLLTEKQRAELQKYMEAIIKVFKEFKEENNLSDDCIKITRHEEGNILSLSITLPSLALYYAFIQGLANNLVPIPDTKAQEKDEIIKDQGLAPNPLSMEPKKEGEEEQKTFSPSPFNMKPW